MKRTPETKAKLSLAALGNKRNWQGGNEQYRGVESEWQAARVECKRLAGGKCNRCGKLGILAHHKVSPEDRISWDNSQENLEWLCRSCRSKEHANG